MTKKVYYHQCKMRKSTGTNSSIWDVAWIPEKFAKIGKHIRIKQENGTWDYDWEVMKVGDTKKEESRLIAGERDYKNQRKMSDV